MAAMLLLLVSPSITYYSRFLRNDVPYLAVTVWCALCLLRAMQTGQRRYVFGTIMAATLMFCMMESSIFFFAACLGFMVLVTMTDWVRGWGKPAGAPRDLPGEAVIFAPRMRDADTHGITSQVLFGTFAAGWVLVAGATWFLYRMAFSTVNLSKDGSVPSDASDPWLAAAGIALLLFPLFWVSASLWPPTGGGRTASGACFTTSCVWHGPTGGSSWLDWPRLLQCSPRCSPRISPRPTARISGEKASS